MGTDAEQHVARARQTAQGLALDPQPELLASPPGGDDLALGAMLRRQEQLRRVDQAPVDAPDRPRDLEVGEEAVGRRGQAVRKARHRLVDDLERPAELVGEPPVRGEAHDPGDQPIGGLATLQQAQVLLDQPAGQLERRRAPRREVEALAGDQLASSPFLRR